MDKVYCIEKLTFKTKEEVEKQYDEVDWKNLQVTYYDEAKDEWTIAPINVFELLEVLGTAFNRKWFIASDITGKIGILFVKYPPEIPGCNWYFYQSIKELIKDIIANQ